MLELVSEAYDRIDGARPLVRPTYNQFEVQCLPPFGDPEVSILGELGVYVAVGVVVDLALEYVER
jgi:hypothetical protein